MRHQLSVDLSVNDLQRLRQEPYTTEIPADFIQQKLEFDSQQTVQMGIMSAENVSVGEVSYHSTEKMAGIYLEDEFCRRCFLTGIWFKIDQVLV